MGTVSAEDGRSTRLTSRRDGLVGTGLVSHAGAPAPMIGPSCSALARGHALRDPQIDARPDSAPDRRQDRGRAAHARC